MLPRGIPVPLTTAEMFHGAQVGCARYLKARRSARKGKFPCPPREAFGVDIWGACAELAFAKAMNLYWAAATERDCGVGDVGGWHVRWRSETHRDLIVQPRDKPDARVVLVVNVEHVFYLVGWIIAGDVQRGTVGTWKEQGEDGIPYPAFFVPQTNLRALDDIEERIA